MKKVELNIKMPKVKPPKKKIDWQKEKPDYACVFLTRHNGDYNLWKFVWEPGEPPETAEDQESRYYYLAWTDKDNLEWDDIDECTYDEYLVLEKLPTMEEVHQQFIASLRID